MVGWYVYTFFPTALLNYVSNIEGYKSGDKDEIQIHVVNSHGSIVHVWGTKTQTIWN